MGRELHNRLQPAAEELCPAVAEWCRRLARTGAAGTADDRERQHGVCPGRDPADALRIARACARRDEGERLRVYVVRSCD